MDHKPQLEIIREIEAASSQVEIGAKYAHYKDLGKIYTVTGFGTLETTDELCVIYQATYGSKLMFIRPVTQWLESVQWQGTLVPRFSKVLG